MAAGEEKQQYPRVNGISCANEDSSIESLSSHRDLDSNTERTHTPQNTNAQEYASSGTSPTSSTKVHNRPIVLYQIKVMEPDKPTKTFYQETPFEGVDNPDIRYAKAHIAYITDITVSEQDKTVKSDTIVSYRHWKSPIKPGHDFKVLKVQNPLILINEKGIQDALRYLIDYYPGQSLVGQIEIHYPFKILFHYYNELQEYRKTYQTKKKYDKPSLDYTLEETKLCTGLTAQCITKLLDMIQHEYDENITAELKRHRSGMAAYKYLWLLFKPGVDVYAKSDDKLMGYVMVSMKHQFKNTASTLGKDAYDKWILTIWNLSYQGQNLYRTPHEATIEEFVGEKEIRSLGIFPSKYLDDHDDNATRKMLEGLGERYFKILCQEPAYKSYSGFTLDPPATKVTPRVS